MHAINTILHPTDFSERSRNAFELACSLANQHQARLILAHVIAPPVPPPLPYNEAGLPNALDETDEAVQARLEQMQSSHPDLHIEIAIATGKQGKEIVRLARQLEADLIVMGTHGRAGLDKALMGSVAEEVVRKAPYQVITVRERTPEETEIASASAR